MAGTSCEASVHIWDIVTASIANSSNASRPALRELRSFAAIEVFEGKRRRLLFYHCGGDHCVNSHPCALLWVAGWCGRYYLLRKRQRARYSAKYVEIDTVRLQNRLAPLIYETETFSYDQIDVHLRTIEETQKDGIRLRKQLDEQRQVLGTVPDIEELAQRSSEIQESMGKLRDAFVSQQAVLALKGITPLDDALIPVSPPLTSLRETEVFNSQVAITDFSASFDELESQYARVQAEEDVAQKVGEIINRKAEGDSF